MAFIDDDSHILAFARIDEIVDYWGEHASFPFLAVDFFRLPSFVKGFVIDEQYVFRLSRDLALVLLSAFASERVLFGMESIAVFHLLRPPEKRSFDAFVFKRFLVYGDDEDLGASVSLGERQRQRRFPKSKPHVKPERERASVFI